MAQDIEMTASADVPAEQPRQVILPPVVMPTPTPLKGELRKTKWLGFVVLLVFFGVGGGWAATAPLGGAVVAKGVVSPEGSRKTIQHLEGGIIRDILVKEGDVVKQGDPLIILEDVGAKAEVGAQTSRLRTLAASEARLTAERSGLEHIKFDHPSLADVRDPEVAGIIAQQQSQFETRRESDQSREAILQQRELQLDQQITGAQRQLVGVRRQLDLIREEIAGVRELYEKGLEKKPRLLGLQRSEADLLGQEGQLIAQIARNQQAIGETRMQIINNRTQRREDVDKDLTETKARLAEVESQIKQTEDRLTRTSIVAPVEGTILNIRFKTLGGVIRPGEPVLDIVPDSGELIIDARISPNDIDDVKSGAHAYVIFPAYPQRNLVRVDATLDYVSADAFSEEKTGQHYFEAKVKIDRAHLHDLDPEIEPTPGMPAEVFITTLDRTLLEYLTQPLIMVVEHSFREH